jgi:hypothetical protein
MPTVSIALTQSDVVSGSNNSKYNYRFPISAFFREGDQVALQTLNIYYSWPNISSTNNNNTFSYIWPTGAGSVTVNITVPNGFYTIEELNAYLQSVMVANNQYLIDSSGNYVYYLQITSNSTLYSFQLNSWPVPTSLPSGYTAPVGFPAYPTTTRTPQFVIPSTNITTLLGFAAGSYPSAPQASAYSATSTQTPQISPVSSVNILCSLLNNSLSRPVNLLYNFAPNTTYGSQIQITPPTMVYQPIQTGTYNEIGISFVDQDFQPLNILDSNISVILSIKK